MSKMLDSQGPEEYANLLVDYAEIKPQELVPDVKSLSGWKSIHDRLLDLYIEESSDLPYFKEHNTTSHLLGKLVKKESLNVLVVNLYPDNEGYTLMLKGKRGNDSETIRMPYEECDMLSYIDHEELPAILLDLLERSQGNLFYSGCVIAEVRDFRRTRNNMFDSRYVLLQPTAHTMLCDINSITTDSNRWTQEDKLNLESQIIMNTNEDLCLNPSPATFHINTRISCQPLCLQGPLLNRCAKRYSQMTLNRKRKLSTMPAPPYLKLHDFISKKGKLRHKSPVNKNVVNYWQRPKLDLAVPESVDVEKFAKMFDKPKPTGDNTLVNVEECTWETSLDLPLNTKMQISKLTVLKRPNSDFYIGEMSMRRNYCKEQNKEQSSDQSKEQARDPSIGSVSRFDLGTRASVDKYINQFTEIITEVGKRPVKMTRRVACNPSILGICTGMTQNTIPSTSQALLAQASNLATSINTQHSGSAQPMKVSLQLTGDHRPNTTGGTFITTIPVTDSRIQQQNASLMSPVTASTPNIATFNQAVPTKDTSQATRRKSQNGNTAMVTIDGQLANINLANINASNLNIANLQMLTSPQENPASILVTSLATPQNSTLQNSNLQNSTPQTTLTPSSPTVLTLVSGVNSGVTTTLSQPGMMAMNVPGKMFVPATIKATPGVTTQRYQPPGTSNQRYQNPGVTTQRYQNPGAANQRFQTPLSLLQIPGQQGVQVLTATNLTPQLSAQGLQHTQGVQPGLQSPQGLQPTAQSIHYTATSSAPQRHGEAVLSPQHILQLSQNAQLVNPQKKAKPRSKKKQAAAKFQ